MAEPEKPNESECRHCGKEITWVVGGTGGRWMHNNPWSWRCNSVGGVMDGTVAGPGVRG